MINAEQARALYAGPIDPDMVRLEDAIKRAAVHERCVTYYVWGQSHQIEKTKERIRDLGFAVTQDPQHTYARWHGGQHVVISW